MKYRERVRRFVPGIALASALASTVAAPQQQSSLDQKTVFMHGFNSNGGTWSGLSEQLRQQLRLTAIAPSITPTNAMVNQATTLGTILSQSYPQTPIEKFPFVAHSQGGIVARVHARQPSNRINGLVTIGSPHLGAPIAAAAVSGQVVNNLAQAHALALYPITWYDQMDPDFGLPWYGAPGYWAISAFDTFVGGYLNPWVQWSCAMLLCQVAAGTWAPSMLEHQPLSQFHQQYLPSTVATENQSLSNRRVSVVATVSAYNAMYRLVSPPVEAGALIAKSLLSSAYVDMYLEYSFHVDPYLSANAWRWIEGAAAINIGLDEAWTVSVAGAPGVAHDGFVPAWSQQMQGASLGTIPALNMAHSEETSTAVSQLRQGLLLLGLQTRPPGSVAFVTLTPSQATVSVGSTLPLAATTYDVMFAPLLGRPIQWVSRTPATVSVASTGVATALSPGTAVVEAISEGYGSLATLNVVPATPLASLLLSGPSSGLSYQTLNYSAQPTGGTTPYSYAWSVNGQLQQSGPLNTFSVSSAGSFTISVVVTDQLGAHASATRSVVVSGCGQQVC